MKLAYGLASKYGVKVYSITAGIVYIHHHFKIIIIYLLNLELVYCVPNYGEVKKMTNRRQLKDKIGFARRGEVILQIVLFIYYSIFYFIIFDNIYL